MKKKSVWRLSIFAVAFVCALFFAMGLTATASAIPANKVVVDYLYETVTVTTDDEIVYFTETYNKDISRWDACEVRNGKAVFDISWINESKTVRLYLCGDKNKDVISVDITWEETFDAEFVGTLLSTDITDAKKWKEIYKNYPNFSEDTGYIIFTVEENGRDNSYFQLGNIWWRKGDDGLWRSFSELDLKEMNIRGISLEFMIGSSSSATARTSSIAKVSVAKLNSAPNILVNPDTMTIGVKNGMEFSFDKKTWTLIPAYNKKFGGPDYLVNQTTREAAIEELLTNQKISGVMMQQILKTQVNTFKTNTPMNEASLKPLSNNGTLFECTKEGVVLYVRDIGTERKAASKISEVIIPYASDDAAIPPQSGTQGIATLEFSYGDSKTNSGGIVLDNKTEYKYQVGVITPDDTVYAAVKNYMDNNTAAEDYDLDLTGVKWTSIKGGKMMKISNKKVPQGSYLLYRIAGEDGQLPSSYRFFGPMEYDHLTYAGIATATIAAGQKLTAVPSTNFEPKEDGTYEKLTFQWQSCLDVKADTPDWADIPNATGATYELTNAYKNQYIRVVITDNHNNVKYSDYVGPVKEVKEEEPEGEEGTTTPTPSVTP